MPPLVRALALLAMIHASPTATIRVVHPVRVANPAAGWVDPAVPGVIFVNGDVDEWRDRIALAGLIAHEQYHVDHGPNEPNAYAKQLRIIHEIGKATRLPAGKVEQQVLQSFLLMATTQ